MVYLSAPVVGTVNGRQCFTCESADCSSRIQCAGDEDRCVSATGVYICGSLVCAVLSISNKMAKYIFNTVEEHTCLGFVTLLEWKSMTLIMYSIGILLCIDIYYCF